MALQLSDKFTSEAGALYSAEKTFAGDGKSASAQLLHTISETTSQAWGALQNIVEGNGNVSDLEVLKQQKSGDVRLEKLWSDNAEELNGTIRGAQKSIKTSGVGV